LCTTQFTKCVCFFFYSWRFGPRRCILTVLNQNLVKCTQLILLPRHNWVYVSSRYINVFLVEVKFWFQRLLWEELRYSSSLLILLYEAKWWLSVITIIWLNEQVPCEVPSRKHTVQSFHNLSIHLWCLYFRNYACYWMTIGRGWTWKFLFIFQLVCVVSWTLFLYFSAACEVLLVDLCYRFNHSS
jgi:hypothetical protein